MKNLVLGMALVAAFSAGTLRANDDDAQFSTILKAFKYWLKADPLIDGRKFTIKDFGNYKDLGAITFDRMFSAPASRWKVYRVANYDYLGNEAPVSYTDVKTSSLGDKKNIMVGGYYFIYRDNVETGPHLIVQPGTAYEYFRTESLYVISDVPSVYYADEKVFHEFKAEFRTELDEKNIYRGGVLQFAGSKPSPQFVNYQFEFMDNIGSLDTKWEDLILEPSLKGQSFDQTEGFFNLFPDLLALGITPKKGVLLAGPPGTGKSLMGQILISSILRGGLKDKATFILITARHLTAKHSIKAIFEEARRLAPAIVFMEDMDLLGTTARSQVGTSPHADAAKKGELLNEFLNGIDGVVDTKGILVVGTTNKWNDVDPGLLRAERLGVHLYYGLPKYAERKEFFEKFAVKKAVLAADVTMEWLAGESEGLSGADIVELIAVARENAYNEASYQGDKLLLTRAHFLKAFSTYQKSYENVARVASPQSLPAALARWKRTLQN